MTCPLESSRRPRWTKAARMADAGAPSGGESGRVSRRNFLRGALRAIRREEPPADESLAALTIAEAGRRIASDEISPIELMRSVLARIERLEPVVGVFVSRVDPEELLV